MIPTWSAERWYGIITKICSRSTSEVYIMIFLTNENPRFTIECEGFHSIAFAENSSYYYSGEAKIINMSGMSRIFQWQNCPWTTCANSPDIWSNSVYQSHEVEYAFKSAKTRTPTDIADELWKAQIEWNYWGGENILWLTKSPIVPIYKRYSMP